MKKIIVLSFSFLLFAPLATSVVACLPDDQKEASSFVSGYLAYFLLFDNKGGSCLPASSMADGSSKGVVFLESDKLVNDNLVFAKFLKSAKIKTNLFVEYWNNLVQEMGRKLNVSAQTDQNKNKYYKFDNRVSVSITRAKMSFNKNSAGKVVWNWDVKEYLATSDFYNLTYVTKNSFTCDQFVDNYVPWYKKKKAV